MSTEELDNDQVADLLARIGKLLQIKGENRFKVGAYEKAAKTIAGHTESVAVMAAEGRLADLRGVGDALSKKLGELLSTGTMTYYEDLKDEVPPTLVPLLDLPGLGAKRVAQLWREHDITSPDDLQAALDDGSLDDVAGFGQRSVDNLRQALARREQHNQRARLADALPRALALVDGLRECPQVIRVSEAGSVRRRCETVHDLDLVASALPDDRPAVMQAFTELDGVAQVVVNGHTKTTVELDGGLRADLRVVDDDQFPTTLAHFTGSKDHNVRLRERAIGRGMKISEYGIDKGDERLAIADERAFYAALDLQYVPPELREDNGELDAAQTRTLPERLIELGDLAGTFHAHSTYSDGTASLREMADAARAAGLRYLGITDHSQSSVIAGGLDPDKLQAQLDELAKLRTDMADEWSADGFQLLSGIEVDILRDGSLDLPDELLERLDVVVASVHNQLDLPRDEMTRRVIAALENPHVDVLGHPTGRKLLVRDGSKIDLDAVIDAAAATRTAIELNASPYRLDLDWQHCRTAAERGVPIAITPDAHSPKALQHLRLGVEVARKAWLTPDQVLNTKPWADIARYFAGDD